MHRFSTGSFKTKFKSEFRILKSAILLCALLFVLCVSADAQQPKKVFRIGYPAAGNPTTESADSEGVRLALQERGYIKGQNIAFEYRYADGKRDRFPELAAELVGLKVDIIVVAGGNTPGRALKNATKTIPIVMAGGSDPVQAGLVESLARPGGNITGITSLTRQLGGKRLELFKEAVPKLTSVAILYYGANPTFTREVKEVLPPIARALKLTIHPWEVRDANDFRRVFAALSKERLDGLYVLRGAPMGTNYKQIAGFALKSRLPSIYSNGEAVDAGGLIYYGADESESYRRVAYFVDRILTGAKPADLPWSNRRSSSSSSI